MRRLLLVLVAVMIVAAVAWVLLPNPFAHGIILGAVSAPAVLIGGLAVFARLLRKRMGQKVKPPPPPLPTSSWDYEMEARDSAGDPMSFSTFVGNVLVLNFWATWCTPCLDEMPSLGRLLEATSDLGVQMACVTNEDWGKVRAFVEKRGMEVPVYVSSGDRPDSFKARGIPATFIIDKHGTIALRHLGAASWDDESVVAFVRGLAATPTA